MSKDYVSDATVTQLRDRSLPRKRRRRKQKSDEAWASENAAAAESGSTRNRLCCGISVCDSNWWHLGIFANHSASTWISPVLCSFPSEIFGGLLGKLNLAAIDSSKSFQVLFEQLFGVILSDFFTGHRVRFCWISLASSEMEKSGQVGVFCLLSSGHLLCRAFLIASVILRIGVSIQASKVTSSFDIEPASGP
ncbi:hypothetical protein ACFX13_019313 [Malus domestica]